MIFKYSSYSNHQTGIHPSLPLEIPLEIGGEKREDAVINTSSKYLEKVSSAQTSQRVSAYMHLSFDNAVPFL